VQYLGYFPDDLQQVPEAIRTFIAHQLQLLWDHTADYPRHPSTRDIHMTLIRQHTGFRFPTGQDKHALETWLHLYGAVEEGSGHNRAFLYAKGSIAEQRQGS
jgi:Domain of unknown function (DUF4158)